MKTVHWIVLSNSYGSGLPWKLGTGLYYLIHMDPDYHENWALDCTIYFTWIQTAMKSGHWIVLFNLHGSRLPWKLGTGLYYLIHMDPDYHENWALDCIIAFTWIQNATKSCITLNRLSHGSRLLRNVASIWIDCKVSQWLDLLTH